MATSTSYKMNFYLEGERYSIMANAFYGIKSLATGRRHMSCGYRVLKGMNRTKTSPRECVANMQFSSLLLTTKQRCDHEI